MEHENQCKINHYQQFFPSPHLYLSLSTAAHIFKQICLNYLVQLQLKANSVEHMSSEANRCAQYLCLVHFDVDAKRACTQNSKAQHIFIESVRHTRQFPYCTVSTDPNVVCERNLEQHERIWNCAICIATNCIQNLQRAWRKGSYYSIWCRHDLNA